MALPMKERRTCERFQLSLPARLEMDSSEKTEIFELHTRDVSAAGALLLGAPSQFPTGTRCQLELIVASERIKELTGVQGLIKIEGTVVRSTPEGVAVCFDGECEILGLKGS
ncbi:MAG: PilZ domain-containing protein [Deltaproteobacteria bacterium]|nr:MAG: PilZ domain-containing protein [Deltaproteobacteria bacterium]